MDVDISEYFHPPNDYNPPDENNLAGNSQFPNLNSIDYRFKKTDNTVNVLPFYEILATNADQTTMLLATNSYTHRLWNGTVFGYERFSDVGKADASVLKLAMDANVMGIRFVDKTMVLFTTANGSIQLWSTQSELRQRTGYNLYQVAKKAEHFGSITGFDLLSKKQAVTGSTDGCLKVWELTPCDIVSEKTYRYAHKEVITDVSCKPQSVDVFATSSRDRHLSIWDKRTMYPLINSCKNEHYANTACLWTEKDLYLGDDTGTVYTYDPRNLNDILSTQKLFDRPIYRFKSNPTGHLIAVLGQTNVVKVISATAPGEIVYENGAANDYVRDICWINTGQNDKSQSFYSVGWNQTTAMHTIN